MIPTDQGFAGNKRSGCQIDLRLEMQLKLMFGDRLSKLTGQRDAL